MKVRPILEWNLWGPLHGLPGSGAITLTLRLVLLRFLNGLVGHVYETLLVTRTDLLYACDHPRVRPLAQRQAVPEGRGVGVPAGLVLEARVAERSRPHARRPPAPRGLKVPGFIAQS